MNNVVEPSAEDMLSELKKRAKEELVTNGAAFEELVDDLIAEKIEWGEMNEDDDYNTLREDLVGRWPEVEEHVIKSETTHP